MFKLKFKLKFKFKFSNPFIFFLFFHSLYSTLYFKSHLKISHKFNDCFIKKNFLTCRMDSNFGASRFLKESNFLCWKTLPIWNRGMEFTYNYSVRWNISLLHIQTIISRYNIHQAIHIDSIS